MPNELVTKWTKVKLNLDHDDVVIMRLIAKLRDRGVITIESACDVLENELCMNTLKKIGEPLHVFRMWNRDEFE